MDLEILIEEVWLKLLEAADLHSTLTTGLIRVDSWGSITPLCLELSPHLSCSSVCGLAKSCPVLAFLLL